MKRKIVSLALAVIVMCGLAACGSEGGAGGKKSADELMTVNIKGVEYDFSEDYEEVIDKLEENKILNIGVKASNSCVNKELDLIVNTYSVERIVDFETADGVTRETTPEELDKLKGFGKEHENDIWMALYVDGKAVDFEKYRENYEEWLDLTTEMVPVEATEECFPDGLKVLAPDSSLGMEQASRILYAEHNDGRRSMKESLEKSSMQETIVNCMLKFFAAADAVQKLDDGEIETYDVIYYSALNGKTVVRYQHYYQDKDWEAPAQ